MARKTFLFGLLLLCFAAVRAQGKIMVRVSNFRNSKGKCLIGLYSSASSFAGKGEPIRFVHVAILDGRAEALLENVPAGTYAISVVHDANNNQKFDKNFLGIPSEGYGASGNKLPFAAAPKFDANKFLVSADATTAVNIRLRYLL